MVNYYRKFIYNYVKIVVFLNVFFKKNFIFIWIKDC